jgi:signal transduction histidine kinase
VLRGAVLPILARHTRGTVIRDVLLWVATGAPAVFGAVVGHSGAVAVTAGLSAAVISAGVVAVGRVLPLAALLAAVLASLWNPLFVFASLCAAYLVGRRMPRLAAAFVMLDAVAVTGITYGIVVEALNWQWWLGTSGWFVFFLVLPWLVGVHRRQQQELADAGWQRAAQLEREHRIVREQAQLRERSRIAQDMHDSLGHELSLIALRAGALEVAPELDEAHRRGAGELRAHATAATERLQEIIGILRERSDPVPLDPAGEGVDDLVERARASGAEVALQRVGDAADLPDMVDRAVYRVVQESMTNAAKHAPGAAIHIEVRHTGEVTVVAGLNAPPSHANGSAAAAGGSGLVALAERVRLAGGGFEAGPDGEGYLVRARFGHRAALQSTAAGWQEVPERSDVAEEMREARRRSRLGFTALIAVAGAAVLVFSIAGVGAVAVDTTTLAVVGAEDFAEVETGAPRSEVEQYLQGGGAFSPVHVNEHPPVPEGAICSYYFPTASLWGRDELYRLCYEEDILVAKDVVEGR